MEKTLDYLKKEARHWPGVSVKYREDWACEYFSVAGKVFCMIGRDKTGTLQMTVKGQPEENEALREQYRQIIPGYHMNKTHWNSILMGTVPFNQHQLLFFLKKSYTLVFAKLPKKIRQKY